MNLYPHQRAAVDFLLANDRACLADDMGLGKTIEAIVAAKEIGEPTLVLAPACVTHNWARELRAWWPGSDPTVATASNDILGEVLVVSHARVAPRGLGSAISNRIRGWGGTVIVDESHCFKNPRAKRTRSLYQHVIADHTARAWCLSGTPMPNNASELWTMCHHLWPHDFPESYALFRETYCELGYSPYGDGVRVVGNRNVSRLRSRLRGRILRRTKDIISLPERRFELVTLRPDRMPAEIQGLEEVFANLPDTHDPEQALADLQAHEEQMSRYRRLCGLVKVPQAVDIIVGDFEAGLDKLVVFAHHREVIERTSEELISQGLLVNTLTGSDSAEDRQTLVDAFQNGGLQVLICQIDAGGVGVTLTAASELIFLEMSWVPGANRQAADRIHRIGQSRPCRVRSLALDGTVDEWIVNSLRRKLASIRELIE